MGGSRNRRAVSSGPQQRAHLTPAAFGHEFPQQGERLRSLSEEIVSRRYDKRPWVTRPRLGELPSTARVARPSRDRLRASPRTRPHHRTPPAPVHRRRPSRSRQTLADRTRRRVHPPIQHGDPRPCRSGAARACATRYRNHRVVLCRARPRGVSPFFDLPANDRATPGHRRTSAAVVTCDAWFGTTTRHLSIRAVSGHPQ